MAVLAARHAIPAISDIREFASAGGLASYGNSISDAYRQVGVYVARILNGAKPAELPVVQPSQIRAGHQPGHRQGARPRNAADAARSRRRGDRMRRREIIRLLGGVIATIPLGARAQQSLPVIGFLNGASPDAFAAYVAAFRQGLNSAGYVEGQNVAIEYRWAGGQYDRLPALAADLVNRQVAVIVATGGVPTVAPAAMAVMSAIPTVFITGDDPVKLGLVASYARPGANATGVSIITTQLEPKRIELLRELVPTGRTIGALVNPNNRLAESQIRAVKEVERAAGFRAVIVTASTEEEFSGAFATLIREKADGLMVGSDPFFNSRRDQLVALAHAHRLPTTYEWREFVVAGGLMSYGVSLPDAYRQVGVYAGRILAGAKPADMPVETAYKT